MELETNKKSKVRSPQYPLIGLKEAIEKISAVYNNDHRNTIAKSVVLDHMGYKSANGKSLGVLAAVTRFGLIEGRSDSFQVSELAVRIIAHEIGSLEFLESVKEAAAKPELYAELDERFKGKSSDQALRSYLLTHGFIPAAADSALRSYRETKQLVEDAEAAYRLSEEHKSASMPTPTPQIETTATGAADANAEINAGTPGVRRVIFALDEGDVVISFPKKMSLESVEDLDAYLQTFMKKARRDAEAQP